MIEVLGLTKYYGTRRAIDHISFTAPQAQVTGLLGLNGAGKSTTMNIITGCLAGSSGRVLIDGIDIEEEPEKAKSRIGYLPEIPPLYMDMKVREYLDFVFEMKKVKGIGKRAHLETVCQKTGVQDVYGRLIKNLSKGYKQRVGLAAALTGDPDILILDEPTAGLDPTQIIEIRSLIIELGHIRTVILSSHILSEVQAVCNRVVILNRGEIAADDTPENLTMAMHNNSSYTVIVEGDDAAVLRTLRSVPGVLDVEKGAREQSGAFEYAITGEAKRDIRRDVSLALSSAGLCMLGTKQRDISFEHVFLELIHGEAADDSGIETGI